MTTTTLARSALVALLVRAMPGAASAQAGGFWADLEERWFDRLPIEIQNPPQRPDGFLGSWWTTGALAATCAGLMLVRRF